ncbi:MAG: transglutaminase family protein [Clostridiales bacterium]|nr:transglutaminase family protein [Clostridiales bacterium]
MEKLSFDYYMRIAFSEIVTQCHYTIKCIPMNTESQHLETLRVEIEPKDTMSRGEDSFGNQYLYGSVDREHREFCFHITGTVLTGRTPWQDCVEEHRLGMYRYPSRYTQMGEALGAYYVRTSPEAEEASYDYAVRLTHRLHEEFFYEKNVTDVSTTAEEAWKLGRGVCQDYAHIMIALCREAGVAARYVTGMMIGEGASHAWVEIAEDGRWYGFDPTNDKPVDDTYIKLGVGRDAADCQINRGLLRGGGAQTQTVDVKVDVCG